MAASNFPSRSIGWLAIAIGAVTVLGVVSLVLFFAIGVSSGCSTTVQWG
jgi:hypothetical protein